jgi:quinol monooxygenase YgiN
VIIVTGSVKARPDTLDELLRISLEHVRRSRLEAGCLLHSVHHDVEYPNRLVFLEHWADRDALTAHFHVPASGQFARALGELAAEPPRIDIYDAEALSF